MATLHHAFEAIIHRTYVSPFETCINSDPKRRHSLRSDEAWVVRRGDGVIGPVGGDCAETIAKSLGVRLRDYPNLIKAEDHKEHCCSDHNDRNGHSTPRTRSFNNGAEGRLTKSQTYVRDYKGLIEELRSTPLKSYISRHLPGRLNATLRLSAVSETSAQAFMQAVESTSDFNLNRLRDVHKLVKRIMIMRDDCMRHALPQELRNPDWTEIEAKPDREKTSGEWIGLAQSRLPQILSRLSVRAFNEGHPYLTKGEFNFCRCLAAKDLGYGWGYLKPSELEAFVKVGEKISPSPGSS